MVAMPHRVVLALLVTGGLLAAAGCMAPQRLVEERGAVEITTDVTAAALAEVQGAEHVLHVYMTRGSEVVETAFPAEGNPVGGTITGLVVGNWHIDLQLRDEEDNTPYQGEASVLVRSDQASSVHIPLTARPGILELTVDLEAYSKKDQVTRARIRFQEKDEHRFERTPDTDQLSTSLELPPGTHDIQIQLYGGDNYVVGNQLYEGYWLPVDIHPGEVTPLLWQPGTDQLELSGEVIFVPPAPESPQLAWDGDALQADWPAVDFADLAGYRIYTRAEPLEPFELLTEVEAPATSHAFVPAEGGSELAVAVSAVSQHGPEGLRSEPVVAPDP